MQKPTKKRISRESTVPIKAESFVPVKVEDPSHNRVKNNQIRHESPDGYKSLDYVILIEY